MGKIYISWDVVFDKSRFLFATHVSSTPSPTSRVVSFPQNEPNDINDHMRKYDLSLLLANSSTAATVPMMNVSVPSVTTTIPSTQLPRLSPPSTETISTSMPDVQIEEFVAAPVHTSPVHNNDSPPVSSAPPTSPTTSPLGATTRGRLGKVFPMKFTN